MRLNKIKKRWAIAFIAVILLGGAGLLYRLLHIEAARDVTLYGNVDIRQIQAAFQDSGRILHVLVQEGDQVLRGQLLAELDPARFQDAIAKAQADVAAQEQALARLLAGSRPEEILQARAEVAEAKAALDNAEITAQRQQSLAHKQFVPKQSVDNAEAVLKSARANLDRTQQALSLAIQGPRKEDIAVARHTLEAGKAALALAQKELEDTHLTAPEAGVVQDRILEPGDMASPQTPVLTLALDNPVWVRAYLPEKEMGLVHPGMKSWIESDSFPGQRFEGWVGFISPTAEFTPKSVETTELRTELMYRVRIYVCNADHRLRLGMPSTVVIPLQDSIPKSGPVHPCGS